MALSRADHLNTKLLDATSGSFTVTSGSFTPQSNSLLVARVSVLAQGNAAADNFLTANSTFSGGSLSWTKRVGVNDDGSRVGDYSGGIEIWTAEVGTAASMTVTHSNTLNCSGGDAVRVAIQVSSYTGYDTSTPTGATASSATLGTSGTGAMTLSGSPASDSVVIAARTIDQDGTTDIPASPGSGWTEIYDFAALTGSEGYACLESQERTGSTSTAVAWTEINVGGLAVFGQAMGVALEIKAAAGGGGGSTELPFLTMAPLSPPRWR